MRNLSLLQFTKIPKQHMREQGINLNINRLLGCWQRKSKECIDPLLNTTREFSNIAGNNISVGQINQLETQ